MRFTDAIVRYQDQLFARYGHKLTRQHRNALQSILDCHSERYGAMVLDCHDCDHQARLFHACGHRACPQCQHHDTRCWLQRQQQKLLPVNYFMVTFTVPFELRSLLWRHQALAYNLLFQCARSTLLDFGLNDNKLGAAMGMTMVLHTHTRRLAFHPHVHVIVPGVCVDPRRNQSSKLAGRYLFNAKALAKVFRGRYLAALALARLTVPVQTPKQWVANCKFVGKGLPALQYLSRYLYRGVIDERAILGDDGRQITFSYRDSATNQYRNRTVDGETFLWLVIQHVLPKGFRRVRDYGFLNGNARQTLQRLQAAFQVLIPKLAPLIRPAVLCASCGSAMSIKGFVPPIWRSG